MARLNYKHIPAEEAAAYRRRYDAARAKVDYYQKKFDALHKQDGPTTAAEIAAVEALMAAEQAFDDLWYEIEDARHRAFLAYMDRRRAEAEKADAAAMRALEGALRAIEEA